MTEYSRFFDGTAYTEAQFAEVMKSVMVTNGVDNRTAGYLVVTQHSPTPDMSVDVAAGGAWIQGAWYNSSAVNTLTISAADGTHPRYDRVVLRLTWADDEIVAAVLEGTPAASPVVPSLTQSASVWEIALATVYIPASCPAIYTSIATNGSYITTAQATTAQGVASANLGVAYITYQGNLEMAGKLVTGAGAPVAGGDLCNKTYVDAHCNVSGMVMLWSGSVATIPSGYVVCDGTTYGAVTAPDLVGRFVIGTKTDSGATYDVGDTGGEATHELITAELPAHTHTMPHFTDVGTTWAISAQNNGAATTNSGSTGSGTPHNNLPPYFALAYIMKT